MKYHLNLIVNGVLQNKAFLTLTILKGTAGSLLAPKNFLHLVIPRDMMINFNPQEVQPNPYLSKSDLQPL